MQEGLIFLVTFISIYIIYKVFVLSKEKALLKWEKVKEISYLKRVYKIKKYNLKEVANNIALANSFIIAITVSIVSIFNNFVTQMLIGFVILISLTILIYHIIGKYYQKKGKR